MLTRRSMAFIHELSEKEAKHARTQRVNWWEAENGNRRWMCLSVKCCHSFVTIINADEKLSNTFSCRNIFRCERDDDANNQNSQHIFSATRAFAAAQNYFSGRAQTLCSTGKCCAGCNMRKRYGRKQKKSNANGIIFNASYTEIILKLNVHGEWSELK